MTHNPTAAEVAEMTVLAAEEMRRFNIAPKAALLAHSNFGSPRFRKRQQERQALALVRERAPDLEVDGEMQGGSALNEALRKRAMPNSTLTGEANLLVFPNLDAGQHLARHRPHHDGRAACRPDPLGRSAAAHILSSSVTSRGVVNMAALAVVEATNKA